jgi:hypothetical protein
MTAQELEHKIIEAQIYCEGKLNTIPTAFYIGSRDRIEVRNSLDNAAHIFMAEWHHESKDGEWIRMCDYPVFVIREKEHHFDFSVDVSKL